MAQICTEEMVSEIEALISRIDNDLEEEDSVPAVRELIPLYDSVVLMKRRYENKLREMRQAASERDAFYGEMQQIRAEHHMAEKIQRSLLPGKPEKYLVTHGVDLFADMDTAWEVGGDYYDFFAIDEDRLFFCVGDVSGKGVSAAIFCSIVKTLISMALQNGEKLDKVCTDVSKRMFQSQNSLSKLFVTLWAGIIDRRDGSVCFINAGHDAPVIIRKDKAPRTIEKRSGLPIASYYNEKKPEKCGYEKGEIKLDPGDMILLYTDGITDSEDSDHNRFGSERIMEKLRELSSEEMSSRDMVLFLERGIDTFANTGERDDDITVLAMRYMGKPKIY